MSWHDFFYFSKGERQALIILLCLITIAGILLILNDKPGQVDGSITERTDHSIVENSHGPMNTSSASFPEVPSSKAPASSTKSSSISSDTNRSLSGKKFDYPPSAIMEDSTRKAPVVTNKSKETVSERVKRITSYSRSSYSRTEKFEKGTVVELNTADTTILKKVPGIGSAYAKRIVNYRTLLGGYYSVMQLSEVYGIDEDRYNAFVPWFTADPLLISKLSVNELSQDSLRRHPYINYNQAKIITQLRQQKGKLSGWANLQLLEEFTDHDKMRLQYYLSFE
jgi:DNA uptake protein ComE-like DNA-binding protein